MAHLDQSENKKQLSDNAGFLGVTFLPQSKFHPNCNKPFNQINRVNTFFQFGRQLGALWPFLSVGKNGYLRSSRAPERFYLQTVHLYEAAE